MGPIVSAGVRPVRSLNNAVPASFTCRRPNHSGTRKKLIPSRYGLMRAPGINDPSPDKGNSGNPDNLGQPVREYPGLVKQDYYVHSAGEGKKVALVTAIERDVVTRTVSAELGQDADDKDKAPRDAQEAPYARLAPSPNHHKQQRTQYHDAQEGAQRDKCDETQPTEERDAAQPVNLTEQV
jgi:hypothetical protein